MPDTSQISINPDFVSAQAAFDAIENELPVIKAWQRQEDGSILVLGLYRLERDASGKISCTGKDGQELDLRLMVRQETVESIIFEHIDMFKDRLDLDVKHFETFVKAYNQDGYVDPRLSSRARTILKRSVGRSVTIPGREITQLAWGILGVEEACFLGRVSARIRGYDRSLTSLAKMLNSFLWADIYDTGIAKAAMLMHGHKAGLRAYNQAAAHWHLSNKDGRECGLSALVETHRPACSLITTFINREQAHDSEIDIVEIISGTPKTLRQMGLKPAAWRFLLKCSIPQLWQIKKIFWRIADEHHAHTTGEYLHSEFMFFDEETESARTRSLEALNILQNTVNRLSDFEPRDLPFSFLKQICQMSLDDQSRMSAVMPAILDGAKRGRKTGRVRLNATLLPLIADALRAYSRDHANWAHDLRNANWNTLLRIQEEWHDNGNFEDDADLAYCWEPLIEASTIDGVDVIELADGHALRAEGRAMHQCVAGYAKRCAGGRRKIISLAHPSDKVIRSTLELALSGSTWEAVQHFTYCNQPVPKPLEGIAKKIVAKANRMQASVQDLPLPMAA